MTTIQNAYVIHDIETSNLSPDNGDIVEISAQCLNWQDLTNNKEVGNFYCLLKPEFPEKADPKAIEVIGKDKWEKALKEGIHPKVGLRKFIEYLKNCNPTGKFWTAPILVGFNNNAFDEPFIIQKMREHKLIDQKKDDRPWYYLQLDLAVLLAPIFKNDNLTNRKLNTYLELLGLKRSSELHGSEEDVELTKLLFVRYMNFMQKVRNNMKIQPVKNG